MHPRCIRMKICQSATFNRTCLWSMPGIKDPEIFKIMEFEVTGHKGKIKKPGVVTVFSTEKPKKTQTLRCWTKTPTVFIWPAGFDARNVPTRSCEIHDWYFLQKKCITDVIPIEFRNQLNKFCLQQRKVLGHVIWVIETHQSLYVHITSILHPSYHSWLFDSCKAFWGVPNQLFMEKVALSLPVISNLIFREIYISITNQYFQKI